MRHTQTEWADRNLRVLWQQEERQIAAVVNQLPLLSSRTRVVPEVSHPSHPVSAAPSPILYPLSFLCRSPAQHPRSPPEPLWLLLALLEALPLPP